MQFAYDANGLRARKTATSGAVTNYILDGLQALLEKDGTGATQVRYAPGLARIASGSVGYYLEDRLGSVVGLTGSNQNMTDTFRYDAWGNLLQQQGMTNPAYQWVGEQGYYLNPDAGLYLLGLRYYSPGTARFLTRDPLGFSGGVNQYRYIENNPINFQDPSGLQTGLLEAPAAVGVGEVVVSNPVIAAGCTVIAAGVAVGYCVGQYTTGPLVEWWLRPRPIPPLRPRPVECKKPKWTCTTKARGTCPPGCGIFTGAGSTQAEAKNAAEKARAAAGCNTPGGNPFNCQCGHTTCRQSANWTVTGFECR